MPTNGKQMDIKEPNWTSRGHGALCKQSFRCPENTAFQRRISNGTWPKNKESLNSQNPARGCPVEIFMPKRLCVCAVGSRTGVITGRGSKERVWQGTKRTRKAVNLKLTAVINPAMLNWKELEGTLRSAPTGLSLLFTTKTSKQRHPNSGEHPRPVSLNSTLYYKPRGLPKEGLAGCSSGTGEARPAGPKAPKADPCCRKDREPAGRTPLAQTR